jgi:hypothetical protein
MQARLAYASAQAVMVSGQPPASAVPSRPVSGAQDPTLGQSMPRRGRRFHVPSLMQATAIVKRSRRKVNFHLSQIESQLVAKRIRPARINYDPLWIRAAARRFRGRRRAG